MKANHQRVLPRIAAVFALLAATLTMSGGAFAAEGPGQVNLNTATADQLGYLPRVGPAVAQRIVEYREANDGFDSTEELMLVRGIGEKTFELLEPYVKTEGETTLAEKVTVSRDEPDAR